MYQFKVYQIESTVGVTVLPITIWLTVLPITVEVVVLPIILTKHVLDDELWKVSGNITQFTC